MCVDSGHRPESRNGGRGIERESPLPFDGNAAEDGTSDGRRRVRIKGVAQDVRRGRYLRLNGRAGRSIAIGSQFPEQNREVRHLG